MITSQIQTLATISSLGSRVGRWYLGAFVYRIFNHLPLPACVVYAAPNLPLSLYPLPHTLPGIFALCLNHWHTPVTQVLPHPISLLLSATLPTMLPGHEVLSHKMTRRPGSQYTHTWTLGKSDICRLDRALRTSQGRVLFWPHINLYILIYGVLSLLRGSGPRRCRSGSRDLQQGRPSYLIKA